MVRRLPAGPVPAARGTLQLQRAAHSPPVVTVKAGAVIQRAIREGEEKNTIYATLDEIKVKGNGTKYLTYNKEYRVDGIVKLDDYADANELKFKLSGIHKTATLLGVKKSQEALGLDVKAKEKEQEKDDTTQEIRNGIAACKVDLIGSAYRHNASGDGKSIFVGQKTNQETDVFITDCLTRTMVNEIKYVGVGKYGGHECLIKFDQTESIAFECDLNAKQANVFHVGPGG